MQALVDQLFVGVNDGEVTVAEIAKRAGLGYETVRSLLRGTSRPRYGPGFFIVAAIAHARDLSLDALSSRANGDTK